jgi:hypothetical protein
VALLLKDRDAPSDVTAGPPGGGPPVVVPDFACVACGAGMQPGQDWCLECGTAAPGRLGQRPGWRSAFSVVAVVLLLLAGAVIASYAALTSDAERQAAAPSQGDGQPVAQVGPTAVAPPAVITPGETGPGTAPPALGPTGSAAAAGTPIIPTTPPALPGNTPVKPPAVTPPPAATTKPPATTPPASPKPNDKPAVAAAAKPEVVKFKADAATTYDPGKRAGAEFGPAANAIDASPKTVWDVTIPADGKPIGAGLMVDLGKPYTLRALRLSTPRGDFEVEVYGAQSAAQTPEDILDKRWEHLTTIKKVKDGKFVSLLNKSKNKQQLLLLYITQPADLADPHAAIGKVLVAGTP